jgi:O-antigen/teichoic acid export membrane protein
LLAAAIVIAGIVAVSHYNADTAIVILIIGAAKACESISDLFYGLLQQHERMDRIAISMAIKGFASVAAFASVYYLTRSVCLGALAMSGAWAIVLVLYDFRSGRLMLGGTRIGGSPIRPRWNRETVLELTRLSFPLGLVILMVSLHTSLPRYFLERYRGESALGVFAAMSYLLMAGTTVVAALGQATSPRLAKYYSDEQWCPFRKLLLALIGIAVVLGAGGLVLALVSGKEILTLIYRPEYAQNTDVFILMTLAAGIGFVASLVGYAVTSTRKFNRLILPTLITTIVGLVCCLALIPDFGLKGSAWTLCAISTANLVTNGLLLLRVMKTRKG